MCGVRLGATVRVFVNHSHICIHIHTCIHVCTVPGSMDCARRPFTLHPLPTLLITYSHRVYSLMFLKHILPMFISFSRLRFSPVPPPVIHSCSPSLHLHTLHPHSQLDGADSGPKRRRLDVDAAVVSLRDPGTKKAALHVFQVE
jgi:hypothetical protein